MTRQVSNTTPERQQVMLYRGSVGLAGLCAAFWCFFNFLTAEDAVVLFNRYNFLEGAPTYFYYAGYASIYPQSVAFAVSGLNPAVQAMLYTLVSFTVFFLLLREVFLATGSGLTTVAVVAICGALTPFMVYNLTFNFWTALAVLGLVGLRASRQQGGLSLSDLLICLPGLAGSPLGIAFLPLFGWVAVTTRSLFAALVCLIILAVFFGLVEPGGGRGDSSGLLSNIVSNVLLIVGQPQSYLLNFTSPGTLGMSVLGSVSFVCALVASGWVLLRWRLAGLPRALYIAGSLLTLVAAVGAAGVPLAGRYWFPIVICALTVMGSIYMRPTLQRVRGFLEITVAVALCVGLLGSLGLRYNKWGGSVQPALQEWQIMLNPPKTLTAITRSWHDSTRWTIGAGQGSVPYDACGDFWEHPNSKARYGFRIYCGAGVF